MKKKPSSKERDALILAGREEGKTYAEIGKALGMTRQGVHSRLKALSKAGQIHREDVLVELLQRTNRLLAGVIVRICKLQTTRSDYPIEVLDGLGLSAQEIAEAIGSSSASVGVTKHRARARATEAVN